MDKKFVKKYIFVNSRDRDTGTNESFVYRLKDFNLRDVQRIKVLDFFLPYAWYNYATNLENNTITIDEGGGPLVATVADGQYSAFTVISVLEAALNSAGALTYTVTIDQTTLRTTIAATGPFEILWNSGTLSYMYKILGFDPVDTGSAASHTGTNSYNFSGPDSVLLKSTILTSRRPCVYKSFTSNYFMRIPVGGFQQTIYYKSDTEYNVLDIGSDNMNIDYIDFSIHFDDEVEHLIDMNGIDFSFTLVCEIDGRQ